MKRIQQLLLSVAILAATCLTASAQSLTSYFPGGYQSRVQGLAVVNSHLAAEGVSLSWDWGVGASGAYTLRDTNVVYDLQNRVFYLRFSNSNGDVRYFGPLYSPDHDPHVTDYFPGPSQYKVNGSYTANSHFLTDNVSLNWNSQLANYGAYVRNDTKVAYDANNRKFYLYDGQNWFGPLY
jgi:hypothetical protein